MPVLIDKKSLSTEVAPGVNRKIAHLNKLLTAIIDITNGPMSEPDPPHAHEHEQISYIAEGELYVFIGDEKHHLHKGDIFLIPSNTPHSIQALSETVRLVDSFSPLREDFL